MPRARDLRLPRRSGWRWAGRAALALAALVALGVLVLGGAIRGLDHPWGKRRVQDLVREQTGLEIDYASTETWAGATSGLHLRGLRVRTPAAFAATAPELLRAEELELEWQAQSLMGQGPPKGRLVLRGVELTVVQDPDGRTSLSAIGSGNPPPAAAPPTPPAEAAAPTPPSALLGELLGKPPVLVGELALEGAAVTLLRREQAAGVWRVRERLRLSGLSLRLQVKEEGAGAQVQLTAGSAAAPLPLLLTRALAGSPAGEAAARLWLRTTAAPAEANLALELRVDRQSFAPRLPARPPKAALQLNAQARFAPARGLTLVSLQRAELTGGAAGLAAELELPDAPSAPRVLRSARATLALESLLPLIPPELLTLALSTTATQLALDVRGLTLPATGLPALEPQGGVALAASWGALRLGLSGGALALQRGRLTLKLEPEAGGGRHRVQAAGQLDGLALAQRGLQVEVAGAGLNAQGRIRADHLPEALDLRLPLARLRLRETRGGKERALLDGPVRLGLQIQDLLPDAARPLRSQGRARLDLEIGAARAQAALQRRGGRVDFLLSAAAESLALLRPLAGEASPPIPWERVGLALRSQGHLTGLGGALPAIDHHSEVQLTRPSLEDRARAVGAEALKLVASSRGTVRKHEAELDLQVRGASYQGRRAGDGHLTLKLDYDLTPSAAPTLRLRLGAEAPAGPEGHVALGLTFDRAARSLAYDVDTRLARLGPLAPWVKALRSFDLTALELGLSGRGVLSGLVEAVGPDGRPRLAARPLESLGADGNLELRLKALRWADGDRSLRAPAVLWSATLKREGERRRLRADLQADALHLAVGEHQLDFLRLRDDLDFTLRGDPTLGEGELTQRLTLGALRQDLAPGYPIGDVAFALTARRSRDGVIRISNLKIDNPQGGTALSLRGGLDLGEERRSLSLRGDLQQRLDRLWQTAADFQGRGTASLGLRLESGNLRLYRVQAAAKVADGHLRLPRRGLGVEALDGEIPLAVDVLLGKSGPRLLRDARVNAYSELRFEDQHPLLDRRSFINAARVTTPWFSAAPLAGNLKIENNIISLNQLEMGLRGGRITGQCLVRWGEKDTSIQLHARASGIQASQRERFDGNAAVEFTTRERNLEGRAEILRIGRRHLLDLLDLHDPHHADPSVNRIRSALSLGYPDKVRLSFDHGFAAARITFDGLARLVRIDELRGIPTGPILDKVLAQPPSKEQDP